MHCWKVNDINDDSCRTSGTVAPDICSVYSMSVTVRRIPHESFFLLRDNYEAYAERKIQSSIRYPKSKRFDTVFF